MNVCFGSFLSLPIEIDKLNEIHYTLKSTFHAHMPLMIKSSRFIDMKTCLLVSFLGAVKAASGSQ